MAKKNKFIEKKCCIGLISMFFLVLMVFLAVDGYFGLKQDLKLHFLSAMDAIDQRLEPLFLEINNFPKNAGSDILFLGRLSSLNDVLNSAGGETEGRMIKDLELDFLGFLKENPAYYKLRYIDEKGNEIVKVEFNSRICRMISKKGLENKIDQNYFQKAISLNEREIFISPIDLHIERGEIENRGTESEPKYVPVIRYAAPVFNYEGESKGIVISNIYADYFLSDVREFQRNGETVFLINEKGHYLAHPDKEKEFAFMFGRRDNFYNDYPEAFEKIFQSKFSRGKFESDDFIFSFRHIYPTMGSFELHRGSEKILGENPEENYFWVLVSVSEKGELNKALEDRSDDFCPDICSRF